MAESLWDDYRQRNPQYDEVDDEELAQQLHREYYSDVDYGEWRAGIGLDPDPAYVPPEKEPPSLLDKALESRDQQLKSDADTLDPELEDFEREKDEDTEVGFVENLGRRGVASVNRIIADTLIGTSAITRPMGVGLELAWLDATMEDGAAKDIAKNYAFNRPNLFDMAGRMQKDRDYGANEATSTQDLERQWEQAEDLGGYTNALVNTIGWGFTEGAASIPDMLATVWNLPLYMASATGRIGDERAKNNGRAQPNAEDMLVAAPFAIGSSLLERAGTKYFEKIFGGATDDIITEVGKDMLERGLQTAKAAGKGAGVEGFTELVQEGIFEYVGETLGTNAKLSFEDAWHRGKWGAIAGGTFGSAAGTLSDVAGQVGATIAGQYIPDEFMNDPDEVTEDDLRDAGDAPDITDPPPEPPPAPPPEPEPTPDPVDMSEEQARETWWGYQDDIDNKKLQLEDIRASDPNDPRIALLEGEISDAIGLQDRIPYQPPSLGDEIGIEPDDLTDDQIPTDPATLEQTVDTALREVKGLGRNTEIPFEGWEMEEMTRRVAAGENPNDVAALFWSDLLTRPTLEDELEGEPGLAEAPAPGKPEGLGDLAWELVQVEPDLVQQIIDSHIGGAAGPFETIGGFGDYFEAQDQDVQDALIELSNYANENPLFNVTGEDAGGPVDVDAVVEHPLTYWASQFGDLLMADVEATDMDWDLATQRFDDLVQSGMDPQAAARQTFLDYDLVNPETLDTMLGLEEGQLGPDDFEYRLEDNDTTMGVFASTGELVGSIDSREYDENTVQIQFSELTSALQGRGIGQRMYEEFIDKQLQRGMDVVSDTIVSEDAIGVYNALARAGYEIEINPNLAEMPIEDEGGRQSTDRKPVFRIIAQPPIAPPVEEVETGTADDDWKFFDSRLRHPDYRARLLSMKQEIMTDQGVGSLIRDEHGNPVGRVTSGNPPWVQSILGDLKMTGKQLHNAIDKALEGKRKLGVRQKAAIEAMLLQIQEERNDPSNLAYYRDALWQKREQRRLRNDPSVDLVSDELVQSILDGTAFDNNPFADFTSEEQLLGTLALILRNRGGDPEPIVSQDISKADIIDQLEEAIHANEISKQDPASDQPAGEDRPAADAETRFVPQDPATHPAVTGQPYQAEGYRADGIDPKQLYNDTEAGYPILGPGEYSFMEEAAADATRDQLGGESTSLVTVNLQNPFVINNDNDLRELAVDLARNDFPNPYSMDPDPAVRLAEYKLFADRIRDVLEARGHDGVVVQWDASTITDEDAGQPIKTIRDVFDQPQVFALQPAGEVQAELVAPEPELQAELDEETKQAEAEQQKKDRAEDAGWTGTLWGEDRGQADIFDTPGVDARVEVEPAPAITNNAQLLEEAITRLSQAFPDDVFDWDPDFQASLIQDMDAGAPLYEILSTMFDLAPEMDLELLETIIPELEIELEGVAEMDEESRLEALSTEEYGVMFVPGQPVTFQATLIEDPTRLADMLDQSEVAPEARYMIHEDPQEQFRDDDPQEIATFENPLYIQRNAKGGMGADQFSWQAVLSEKYQAMGRELSQAIARDGYDAIITIATFDGVATGTSTIVDLRGVTPVDRRGDQALRDRWDAMSPDEQFALSLEDKLSGLGNTRYMEETKEGVKFFAFLDLDNLGPINDFLGHDAGDALIAAAGEIIRRYTERGTAFRPGGDEFVLFGDSMEDLQDTIEHINRELAGAGVGNSKGELKGLNGSWGLGTTIERADMAMMQEKKTRTEAGSREQLAKGEKPKNLHMSGTSQDEIQKSQNPMDDVQAMQPGKNYVPMIGKLKALPLDANDNYVLSDGRRVRIPKKPLRVVHILRMMQDVLGLNIYEGRIKGPRTELGYYRAKYGEIRTKYHNDLEVSAHEVGHWFDDRMPFIEELYNQQPFNEELLGVSYDEKSVSEGFAEYFRLWFTQEHEAVKRAPMFHDAFMADLEGNHPEVYKQLRTLQEMFHAWYFQGADARIKSQIGGGKPTDIPLSIWWKEWSDHATDWVLQKMFDGFRRVKQFERAMQGFVQDAEFSPWKNFIMTKNSGEMTKFALERGTFNWSDDRRSFETTGESLRDVFATVDDGRIEKALLYIVGLRARQLESQNRRSGFTATDIRRMVSYGEGDPDIRDANERYQAWNDRMLEFYVSSGILNESQVAKFKDWNENYIPFNRVVEAFEKRGAIGKGATPFKRLVGSDRNLEDVMASIISNTSHLVQLALVNESKALMYDMIERGSVNNPQETANWAVPIKEEARKVSVPKQRVEDAIINALGYTRKEYDQIIELGAVTNEEEYLLARVAEAVNSNMEEFVEFWFQDKAPEGMVDFVFRDGNKYYYEIADPLLFEAIQHAGPKAFHWSIRVLGGFSSVLRTGIVSFPVFQARNFIRDTMQAWSLSKGKTLPIISAVRELFSRAARDGVYHEYILNGGGFASIAQAEGISMHQVMDMNQPVRSIPGGAKRLLHQWQRIIGTMEYANRVAEYRGQVARGKSEREAAFAGRQISTDFAMRGSSKLVQAIAVMIPFLNARMQGGYRLGREIMSRPPGERLKLRGRDAALYATKAFMSVTIPTIILYAMNEDDEVYKELPDSTRDLNWFFRTGPGEDDYILIPKPFETGLMWGTSWERMIEYLRTGDENELADAIIWNFINTFSIDLPAAIRPVDELRRNKNWTGAPIVPDYMHDDVEPYLEYNHYTSDAMVALGEKWNVSPLRAQHLVEGYLGTAGQYMLSIADFMTGDFNNGDIPPRPEWRPEDSEVAFQAFGRDFYESLPTEIVGSLFLEPFVDHGPLKRTRSQEDFYKLLGEARMAANSVELMKLRDVQKLNEYLSLQDKRRFYAIEEALNDVQTQVNEINRAIEITSASKTMDANRKRAKIDDYMRKRNRLYTRVMDKMRDERTENVIDRILGMDMPEDPNDDRSLPEQVAVE